MLFSKHAFLMIFGCFRMVVFVCSTEEIGHHAWRNEKFAYTRLCPDSLVFGCLKQDDKQVSHYPNSGVTIHVKPNYKRQGWGK